MTEKERRYLVELANEEHRKKLEAIQIVYELSLPSPNGSAAPPTEPSPGGTKETPKVGTIASAMEQEIAKLGEFTLHDIIKGLKERDLPAKKSTVRSYLKRLTKRGVIEAKEVGIGTNPSVYRYKDQ